MSHVIAFHKNKPQPVKQKIRYHTSVTVCIAVACQEQDEPRIVLCSDTRLDYEYCGSTNTTVKVDVLGYGWCAQMAGEWSGVKELCAILKRRVQKFPSSLRASDMTNAAQRSIAEFLKSPLYERGQPFQLLVSGFDERTPVIFDVSVYPENFTIKSKNGFGSVGSGSAIASTLLQLRECHSNLPLSYATYLAYEAKRASEKCGDVGRITVLSVQAPPTHDDKERAWIKVMSEQGKSNLESLYRTLWKIPVVETPELTDDCFIDPIKKQSPE